MTNILTTFIGLSWLIASLFEAMNANPFMALSLGLGGLAIIWLPLIIESTR